MERQPRDQSSYKRDLDKHNLAERDLAERVIDCIDQKKAENLQTVILEIEDYIKNNDKDSVNDLLYAYDPVCKAVETGNDGCFNLLLESGFQSNNYMFDSEWRKDFTLMRPIHLAAICGHIHFAKRLIEKYGVPVDCLDSNGKTPLMYAIGVKRITMMDFLIHKGADVNHRYVNTRPICMAINQRGDIKVVLKLIEAGASMDIRFGQRSLFHRAAILGRFDIAELLYQNGAPICEHCDELWGKGDLQLTKFLIKVNAPMGNPSDREEAAKKFLNKMASPADDTRDQWLDLLTNAGHWLPRVNWDTVWENVTEGRATKLKNAFRGRPITPLNLQHLCVFGIRDILGLSLKDSVHSLPLPPAMKRRVCLEHLY